MLRLPKARTWTVLLFTVGFLGLLLTKVAREDFGNGTCRTEPIRQNLAHLRKILLAQETPLAMLQDVHGREQEALMTSVVDVFRNYLLPHLAAEEAVLYPEIERQLAGTPVPPTQAMIQEHAIMRLWIRELEAIAHSPMPDRHAFARRGERLLGLIEAHFEVDEGLLFPVLDQERPLTRR